MASPFYVHIIHIPLLSYLRELGHLIWPWSEGQRNNISFALESDLIKFHFIQTKINQKKPAAMWFNKTPAKTVS